MIICLPKESDPSETRAAMTPANVARLVRLGADLQFEPGLGAGCGVSDSDYSSAGGTLVSDRKAMLSGGEVVLRVRKPSLEEVEWLKPGALHVSFLDPFKEPEPIHKLAYMRCVNCSQ
jgi:NAD(P) transhydrogenase subunit alpha